MLLGDAGGGLEGTGGGGRGAAWAWAWTWALLTADWRWRRQRKEPACVVGAQTHALTPLLDNESADHDLLIMFMGAGVAEKSLREATDGDDDAFSWQATALWCFASSAIRSEELILFVQKMGTERKRKLAERDEQSLTPWFDHQSGKLRYTRSPCNSKFCAASGSSTLGKRQHHADSCYKS